MESDTAAGQEAWLRAALEREHEITAGISRLWGDHAGGEAIMRLIAGAAGALSPAALARIYSFDPSQHRLTLVAASADVPSRGDLNLAQRAVEQGGPVFSGNPGGVAGVRDVALPLRAGKDVIGVLHLQDTQARPFSTVELLLLENLAYLAAIAIFHAGQLSGVQRDLARKEEELRRLRRAGLLISSRTRLDQTLVTILQMALELTGAKYGIFRLVDEERKNLIMRAIAGDRLGHPAVEALPMDGTSVMSVAAITRQPLCIPDVQAEPWAHIYYPLDRALQMRSELAVPLIGASGRLEGVLNLESPIIGAFDEDDSHLLQGLATQAVIAIQEVRLLDALQEMAERLLTQPAPQTLEHLVALACKLLNAGASAIWTLNGNILTLAAASGGHLRGQNLTLEGSLTGQAIISRGPVTSDDVRSDPRFGWPDLARSQGWKQALVVPLLASDGEPVGAFSIYGSEGEPGQLAASDWDTKVLTILAHYAALAVRHAAGEAALQEAEEQRVAAETFAAVGDIAANLLHQINNKIGTIPVRVEGIQDKSSAAVQADPYLATNLEEIGRSAREAMDAMRASLSHLQASQAGPVSVSGCIVDALGRSHLPATVHVRTAGVDGLPPVVAAQQGLTLVFSNLLENAMDAMGGAGKIDIAGRSGQDWVEVDVCDSGPGIAPELHERIFELSYSGRRGARAGRLGFGLWWVKTWMTRLGGSIAVQSDGQSGTCFTLRLPRAGDAS